MRLGLGEQAPDRAWPTLLRNCPLFERLCIQPALTVEENRGIDLGLLAEGLLFYGTVYLVANRSVLTDLMQRLGPELTLRLAEEDRLRISYSNRFSGVYSEDVGRPTERHFLTVAEMPHTAVDRLAPELFAEVTGKSGRGRRLAARFLRHVSRTDLDESIADSAREDALDASYVLSAVETALSSIAPHYKPSGGLRFELESLPDRRYRIHTNLDVEAATHAMAQPSLGDRIKVDPPLLASFLVSVHEGLAFASSFYSDLATSPLMSHLLRLKWASLVKQSEDAAKQIGEFQDFAFDDSRAIADAVRSGAVSFGDVLDVVERSKSFRRWLDGKDNDANLLRDYFRECTKDTLFDRLPVAVARWGLVTGVSTVAGVAIAGPAGIVGGVAIGAADFVVDRVRQGWKPNHFVEREMKRLTR